MFLLNTILTVIFGLRLIFADVVVCDNNECKRASVLTADSLFSELSAISNANRNTTELLKEINARIDHNVANLATEIESLKDVLHEKANSENEIDYSLYDNLWIVVQVRQDGSVDFYKNWTEYKQGFGNRWGEFFVGLEKLYDLTNSREHELLIILENFEGVVKYAHYDNFLIGNETEGYLLKKLGKYKGTAGDHLRPHLNMYFSTKDRDNDGADNGNCAEWFKGAWWYYHCLTSNLNGPYRYSRYLRESERGMGIAWGDYKQIQYSYKTAQMLLRSKQ